MNFFVNIFIQYGDSAAAKRCSTDYSREELVSYVCSRWSDLSKDNVELVYHLRGHVELLQHDEDDMSAMFVLMLEWQLQSINVTVTHIDGRLAQSSRSGFSQPNFDLVNVGRMEVVDWTPEQPVIALQYDLRLRSEEWRNLIVGVEH